MGADRAGQRLGDAGQLGRGPGVGLERRHPEGRLRVGGGGEGARHLPQGLGEGFGVDIVPGSEPGMALAGEADGEPLFPAHAQAGTFVLGRQLGLLAALEEGVHHVIGLLGDLGKGAGDGGGVQLGERHPSDCMR
jgi:hypothetical protein